MTVEYAGLQAKAARTPDEEKRYQLLDAKIADNRKQLRLFLEQTLYPELAETSIDANERLADTKRDVSQLQNTLRSLGPTVIGVPTLVGREHTYVIVVTANAYFKYEVAVPSRDPYLQLSGGRLTLSALQDSTINFSKTRLLTLSACSTEQAASNPMAARLIR